LVIGLVVALSVSGLGGLGALLTVWPRVQAHDGLVDENVELRLRLLAMDQTMDALETTLHRLRMYDTQLRTVVESPLLEGGSGPLDEGEAPWANPEAEAASPYAPAGRPIATGEPMDDIDGPDGEIVPDDLRPGQLWAAAVETRAARLLGRVRQVEPRLSALVEDVEDRRSEVESLPSLWPVQGRFTSGFGYRRSPFNRRWKLHSGIDIAAARGTPVVAPADGLVVFSGYNQGYGRMLEVDHGYGVTSRLAHHTSLLVRKGERVERGQVIATVGSTGRATGPHLHYEVLIDGVACDPLDYLDAP
jgi:murein DD-endopeptidase MepM/ murein hydrolase activator NlpD